MFYSCNGTVSFHISGRALKDNDIQNFVTMNGDVSSTLYQSIKVNSWVQCLKVNKTMRKIPTFISILKFVISHYMGLFDMCYKINNITLRSMIENQLDLIMPPLSPWSMGMSRYAII